MDDATIDARLKRLEMWAEGLEKRLVANSGQLPPQVLPTPPSRSGGAGPSVEVAQPVPLVGRPAPTSAASEVGAGQVLGIVAVACFVLAAAFLVKLAADSGWLTPFRQWASAMALGLGLIGAGLGFKHRDEGYFALLPGAGVVVLYIAAYAGHLRFGLYGMGPTLLLLCGMGAGCVSLFFAFRQDFYLVTAAVGSYLVPILVPTVQTESLVTAPYFLLWDILFAGLAIALGRRVLIQVAAYLALASFAFTHPSIGFSASDGDIWSACLFQAVQFAIFAVATVLFTVLRKRPLSLMQATAAMPVLLFFYGLEFFYVYRLNPELAPWAGFAFSLVIVALYAVARRFRLGDALPSGPVISGYVALLWFHTVYLQLVPSEAAPWFALLLVGVMVAVERVTKLGKRHAMATAVGGLVFALEYGRLVLTSRFFDDLTLIVLHFAFAATLFLAWRFGRERSGDDASLGFEWPCLSLAHLQAMLGLYRVTEWLSPGSQEGILLSVLWALYALAILGTAYVMRRPVLAHSALGVFAISVVKALIVDMSGAGQVARIFSFLGLGVILFIAGLGFKKIQAWEAPKTDDG